MFQGAVQEPGPLPIQIGPDRIASHFMQADSGQHRARRTPHQLQGGVVGVLGYDLSQSGEKGIGRRDLPLGGDAASQEP